MTTPAHLLPRKANEGHFLVEEPCPGCGRTDSIFGYYFLTPEGQHQHTHYVCTSWPHPGDRCGWHGWSVPSKGSFDTSEAPRVSPFLTPRKIIEHLASGGEIEFQHYLADEKRFEWGPTTPGRPVRWDRKPLDDPDFYQHKRYRLVPLPEGADDTTEQACFWQSALESIEARDAEGQYSYSVGTGSTLQRWKAPTPLGLAQICPMFTQADLQRLYQDEQAMVGQAMEVALISDEVGFTPRPGQRPIGHLKHNGCGEIIWRQIGHPSNDPTDDSGWKPVYLVKP